LTLKPMGGLGRAASCLAVQNPKFYDRCRDHCGFARPARRAASRCGLTGATVPRPVHVLASFGRRSSTSRRSRLLESGYPGQCSVHSLVHLSWNVIRNSMHYMVNCNSAHACWVRAHMGCAGNAGRGSFARSKAIGGTWDLEADGATMRRTDEGSCHETSFSGAIGHDCHGGPRGLLGTADCVGELIVKGPFLLRASGQWSMPFPPL
jgi:hypothetical protein